jgi:thymidylate kinase
MGTSDFLKTIFDFLNTETEYAVLRNFEGLPHHNNSRDIDIAIKKSELQKIRPQLISLIEQCGWHIVTYLNSDRLVTWVCGVVHENNCTDLVQLDFFYHTSIFGIVLIENKEILKHRLFNGQVYHADKVFEFLDKYMYDRAVGATYPDKYKNTRQMAENDPLVKKLLVDIFGKNNLAACDKAGKKELLKAALKWNFHRFGWGTIANFLQFEYYHIKNYLCSNTGFSIGFTGPDGSGKTTVIDLLIENLGDVFRKAHTYYHFRPTLFGNLGEIAHSAGVKKDVDRDFSNPHRGNKTGKLSSLARLNYYSMDYIIGYWVKVKSVIRITRIVIFDRYYTDIICDSRRSRIYLNPKFLYNFGRLLIPSLDYNILLTASSDAILARKRELDKAGIEAINQKIDYLADKKGYYKILNENAPQEAVTKILRIVFEEQHKKNLKRMKYGSCKI